MCWLGAVFDAADGWRSRTKKESKKVRAMMAHTDGCCGTKKKKPDVRDVMVFAGAGRQMVAKDYVN